MGIWAGCVPVAAGRADTLIEWAQDKDGPEKSYAVNGLKLTVSAAENAAGEDPRLDVVSSGGAAVTVFGAPRGIRKPPAQLRVTRLDPGHSAVDVMFGVYTGGAHCCIAIKVLSLIGGRWKTVDLGIWDGDSMPEPLEAPRGAAGVLRFYDNAFLFAFADYADSFAPLKLLRVVNGKEVDVSADRRFLDLYRRNMADAREACARHQNSGCATYVADALRADAYPEAWAFMLRNYDRTSDWKLDFCDPGASGCAKRIVFHSFPRALGWFLRKHGYLAAHRPAPGG